MNTVRDVVVIVGSLRKESLNRKMAMVLRAMAPASMKLEIIEIGDLPLFNADLEAIRRRQPSRSRRASRKPMRCSS